MVMPLDLFVTPFMDPTRYKRSTALAEFGQSLTDQANTNRKMAEQSRQFDATHSLQTEEARGKNKYYEDLIDQRREASRDKNQQLTEAKVGKLLDQMRKSAHDGKWDEVESIRQQLTGLGYATEESDTSVLPEGAPEPPSPAAPAPGGPPTLKKGANALSPETQKALKPGMKPGAASPGFASALDTFMRTENEDKRLGENAAGAAVSPVDLFSSPGEPKKKGPGGRFTVKDREGNTVQVLDIPQEKANRRSAIENALSSYIDTPQNPEGQAAMKRATAFAQNAIDTGMPADRALKMGADQYNKEMGTYKNQRLPSAVGTGGGGGGLGVGKQEQARLGGVDDNVRDIIFKIEDKNKLPDARKALGDIANMDSALDKAEREGDGFSGGAALSSYLKAISGATVSEQEVNRIWGGAGMDVKWQADIDRYINGGRIPSELIQGLRGVAARARETFRARSEEAARQAENMIGGLNSLSTPEERKRQVDVARNHFMGFSGSGGSGSPKGAAPGANDGDARRKALEDKLRGMNLD